MPSGATRWTAVALVVALAAGPAGAAVELWLSSGRVLMVERLEREADGYRVLVDGVPVTLPFAVVEKIRIVGDVEGATSTEGERPPATDPIDAPELRAAPIAGTDPESTSTPIEGAADGGPPTSDPERAADEVPARDRPFGQPIDAVHFSTVVWPESRFDTTWLPDQLWLRPLPDDPLRTVVWPERRFDTSWRPDQLWPPRESVVAPVLSTDGLTPETFAHDRPAVVVPETVDP